MPNSPTTPIAIATIAAVAFICLGLHLGCLVDCAVDDDFSKGKKTLWVIVLQLTSIIGGLIYAIFVTRSQALRFSTILSILAIIGGVWYLVHNPQLNPPTAHAQPAVTTHKHVAKHIPLHDTDTGAN